MSTASRIRGGFINPNAPPFSRSDLMVGPTACAPYDEACSNYLAALDELEAERDLEGEQLFDALEALEALEVALDRAHETSGRVRWLQPDDLHATFGKANAGRRFDAARLLTKLRSALTDAADRTPMIYLSPKEARRWQEGKAVKDVNGRDVPSDIRPSRVKISYSPNGLQESPLGKASDRE